MTKEKVVKRAKIIQDLRGFFIERGFLEVTTPALVPTPSLEPYLTPLDTSFTDARGQIYTGSLITSPEYSLKKLLAAGLADKIFEIVKVWRGGEALGGLHNPEFTMIEWYRLTADYRALMTDTEELVNFLAGDEALTYQGEKIDLTRPWPRLTMAAAWQKYADLELNNFLEPAKMAELARERGYQVLASDSFDDLFFKIFLNEIEPKLTRPASHPDPALAGEGSHSVSRPLFLYEYPSQMAALSRLSKSDPRYAERFELYLGGLELANAFSELNDPVEQRRRLVEDQETRRRLGKKVYPLDESFLSALKNLPDCAGIALGVDRLIMLLTDSQSIDEVIAFPTSELFTNTE